MITKYLIDPPNRIDIMPVEIVKETKCYFQCAGSWYDGGGRHDKKDVFDTWEAARTELLERLMAKVTRRLHDVEIAQKRVDIVKQMQPPCTPVN
jgi:hypothetical protein